MLCPPDRALTDDTRSHVDAVLPREARPRCCRGRNKEITGACEEVSGEPAAARVREKSSFDNPYTASSPTRPYVPSGTTMARSVFRSALPRAGTTPSYALQRKREGHARHPAGGERERAKQTPRNNLSRPPFFPPLHSPAQVVPRRAGGRARRGNRVLGKLLDLKDCSGCHRRDRATHSRNCN